MPRFLGDLHWIAGIGYVDQDELKLRGLPTFVSLPHPDSVFFPSKNIIICVCVCLVYMYATHVCRCLQMPEEGIRTGITEGCEPPDVSVGT